MVTPLHLYFIIYLSFFSFFSCRVSDSPYTKNESYGFVTEKQWAVPTSIEFWDYIFANASGWGLNTIKQDHIVCSSSSLFLIFLFSFGKYLYPKC